VYESGVALRFPPQSKKPPLLPGGGKSKLRAGLFSVALVITITIIQ